MHRIAEGERSRSRRWGLAVAAGLLLATAARAEPGCQATRSSAVDRDGAQWTLEVALCRAAGERRIRADLRPAPGAPERVVLRAKQRLEEAPDGTAELIDLDGDGRHEVELRGSCGTGPNCEGTIFRLNADGSAMAPYFRGGYATLSMIDGYLVEGGRASCCAWEFHGYRVEPTAAEVTEADMVLRIDVTAEGGEDGAPLAVECSFHRRQGAKWSDVEPPSAAWLPLCEQYGETYALRRPAGPGH